MVRKYFLLLRDNVILVLLISGFFGFCLGAFAFPTWQDAIEAAQVMGGVVKYPPQSIMYISDMKFWSLIYQICALLLRIGVSERALSFFLSGITGMVSYQALALSALAISKSPLLSLITPFFIHATNLWVGGVTYNVILIGEHNTFGIIGLSYMVLVAALISLGKYKLGGLLLGIAPSIHPNVGSVFTAVVFFCFIWDLRFLRDILKQAVKYVIIGYSITIISLLFYLFLLQVNDLNIHTNINLDVAYAFIEYWFGDIRRFRLSLLKPVILTVSMCFLWATLWRRDLDLPKNYSTFLLRCCIVSAILASIFSLAYWFPVEKVPLLLFKLNPSRLYNFDFFVFAPLLLGLLWRYRNNFLSQLNFTTFVIASYRNGPFWLAFFILILVALKMALGISGKSALIVLGSLVFVLVMTLILRLKPFVFASYFSGLVLIFTVWLSKSKGGLKNLFQSQEILGPLRTATLGMLCVSIFTVGKMAVFEGKYCRFSLRDKSNDRFFAEVRKRQGMLLTGPALVLIQPRARRPVLLSAQDFLVYVPQVGPEMNRILQRIYGADIFHPPELVRYWRMATLPRETGKNLWESRTQAEWLLIRKEFGVTDILTYGDWELQLPEVARSNSLVLYAIPDKIPK